jgi:hypothetical protein
LREGDKVFIRLHKGYNLNSRIHKKIGAQRTGPFRVKRVFTNAYELDIPKHWRVHPVISVEHLEPAPDGADPYYDRPTNDGSNIEPVTQDGDTEEWQSWEIEKPVDKRIRKYGKGKPELEYLIRWKG